MAKGLHWRGETKRERKSGDLDLTKRSKTVELCRYQAGGREAEALALGGRGLG